MAVIIGDEVRYEVGKKPIFTGKMIVAPGGSTPPAGTTVPQNQVPTTPPTPASSASSGSGSGGVSYSAASSMSASEAFFDWMGRYPTSAEKSKMASEGWTEDTIRRFAVKNGGNGSLMQMARNSLRQIAAPFFGGDPSGIPVSLVNTLISDGTFNDPNYLTNTYFPMLKGVGADNPNTAPFLDDWTTMTGRSLGPTAAAKLQDIVRTYGFTDVGRAAWQDWIKTTDSAITGNWGADHRAGITKDVGSILGRAPTLAELDPKGDFWNLNDNARLESLRATPEYESIYTGKPAWMTESDWIGASQGYDAVMRWYYGDAVTLNGDGSLTIPHGDFYQPPANQVMPTLPTSYKTAAPSWKSLTVDQFVTDLGALGIQVTGTGALTSRSYTKGGEPIAYGDLDSFLPADTYYKDAQGYHYVQDYGALNPTTGQAATITKPAPVPTAVTPAPVAALPGLNNFGVSYLDPGMVADLIAGNITPDQLRQQFAWTEDAAYMQGVYGPVMEEAFGGTAGIDWYKLASGAQGSGAMRAQLAEAQNRVGYREAYRQVFGTDPNPGDYDRITQEFVSPAELIRENAALQSAKEMAPEVNDLLTRVFGDGVTEDELKDMALGRPGSGDLRARINEATKLDAYRGELKMYNGYEPTPDDYASFAGYSGVPEYKWEITTNEAIKELGPEINQAMQAAYPDEPPLSQDELRTMLGDMEGSGDLKARYRAAQKIQTEQKSARDWQYQQEGANIGYQKAEQGGFEVSAPGLENL